MRFLCNQCAPENIDDFYMGKEIIGTCENDDCFNHDYPVDQMPIRDYTLRESCGGED